MQKSLFIKLFCATALAVIGQIASATPGAGSHSALPRVTQTISMSQRVTLPANTRALSRATADLGPVEDSLRLGHVYITLKRSPQQQAAFTALLEHQQQRSSPQYHRWLTPQQYGEQFGVSEHDISAITTWLESQGFRINNVPYSGMFIDVAGTAGSVRKTFRTQLHYLQVRGEKRFANVQNPQIPAALREVIAGITGLSNIRPEPNHTRLRNARLDASTHRFILERNVESQLPNFTNTSGDYLVGPQDFYTIYNTSPLYAAGTNGGKATIAVVEESDIQYGTVDPSTGIATGGDVANFRSIFGVNAASDRWKMYVYHGYGEDTCSAPGVDPPGNGEDIEATLDAEWATAAAPAATLIFMSCDDTMDDGIFSSMQALIDNNLSDAMSLSYGLSELSMNDSDYAYLDSLYQQAAVQGQSIIISAGDSGSDVQDDNTYYGSSGLNVNGFASSPYVTSAGGTDFSDYFDGVQGGPSQTTYWNNGNSNYYGSALGYVPETAWNSNCSSALLNVLQQTTPDELCAQDEIGITTAGGSGGISVHYALPAYQNGVPGVKGNFRAQPDISLFASNGAWEHALLLCLSNPKYHGQYACTNSQNFGAAGGTSFVAPQIAGIAGLLVGYTGQRQGVLNYAIYALAKNQYASTPTACYANGQTVNDGVTTALPASSCIFNDVTTGNNSLPCEVGTPDCYGSGGGGGGDLLGVLSTSTSSLEIAYPAGPQYDLATGLGSLNIANFVRQWNSAFGSSTTLNVSQTTIPLAGSLTLGAAITVSGPNGIPSAPITGSVTFYADTKSLGGCTLNNASCTVLVNGTAFGGAGNYAVTASYSGNPSYPSSTSEAQNVSVTSPTAVAGINVTATPYQVQIGGSVALMAELSGQAGTPTGTITFSSENVKLGKCILSGGTCSIQASSAGVSAGTYKVVASYSGDMNYAASVSPGTNVQVVKIETQTSLSGNPLTVTRPESVQLTALVSTSSGQVTGSVSFYYGTQLLGAASVDNTGTAVLSHSSAGVASGSYSIHAQYNGDTKHAASISNSITVAVQ